MFLYTWIICSGNFNKTENRRTPQHHLLHLNSNGKLYILQKCYIVLMYSASYLVLKLAICFFYLWALFEKFLFIFTLLFVYALCYELLTFFWVWYLSFKNELYQLWEKNSVNVNRYMLNKSTEKISLKLFCLYFQK